MSLSGLILTTCRLFLESSIPLSWKKEGMVTEGFTIQATTAKCEDSVKLLGVTINYMIDFELHVSNICKKAAKQINVLCRLSHYLNIETKLLIYKSFKRSHFSYCLLVWHFCSKTSTDKMEKLEYRALRLVYSDFDRCYEDLLKKAI